MRSLRQGGRTGPLLLPGTRFQDDTVACNIDLPVLALDADRVGALLGGPRKIDLAGSGHQIERDSCRVFERPFVEMALFEHGGDTAGSTGPMRDAIERVPAVIEQDASAGDR